MQVDHAACPNCAYIWQFEGPVDTGEIAHCDRCARDFRVGRWYGQFYPNLFGSLFRKPVCPQCGGTNSKRGIQVGFYSLSLYMRQCQDCYGVWVARK